VAQKAVELILMRQLASYLAVPIFLVDPDGNLLYYNEPAERLLGRRYDETGEMPVTEWSTVFTPTAEDGTPVPPEDLPLSIALRNWHPAHRPLAIRGLDGVDRRIAVTAFPLEGQGRRRLGAVAIFWERPS
jgi:PAS domain-containing protein